MPAATFLGSRVGYEFKTGPASTGYYAVGASVGSIKALRAVQVSTLAAGGGTSLAVAAGGAVLGWGMGVVPVLGLGLTDNQPTPLQYSSGELRVQEHKAPGPPCLEPFNWRSLNREHERLAAKEERRVR